MRERNELINVYTLQNHVDYFLQGVYILEYVDSYHLLVIHNNRIRFEHDYGTFDGAQKGFKKRFKHREWAHEQWPLWTRIVSAKSDDYIGIGSGVIEFTTVPPGSMPLLRRQTRG